MVLFVDICVRLLLEFLSRKTLLDFGVMSLNGQTINSQKLMTMSQSMVIGLLSWTSTQLNVNS